MIFTVGTQKRIHLPDQILLQRFGFVIIVTVGVLAAWTGSTQPEVDTLETSNKLKFYVCKLGHWEYGIIGGKVGFLPFIITKPMGTKF